MPAPQAPNFFTASEARPTTNANLAVAQAHIARKRVAKCLLGKDPVVFDWIGVIQ
jgi:hypothetical protein